MSAVESPQPSTPSRSGTAASAQASPYSVLVVGAMLLVLVSASYIVVPSLLAKVLGRLGSLLPLVVQIGRAHV